MAKLAKWCEDKRNELPDSGEMEALHWIVFELGFQRHDGVFNACDACSFFWVVPLILGLPFRGARRWNGGVDYAVVRTEAKVEGRTYANCVCVRFRDGNLNFFKCLGSWTRNLKFALQ